MRARRARRAGSLLGRRVGGGDGRGGGRGLGLFLGAFPVLAAAAALAPGAGFRSNPAGNSAYLRASASRGTPERGWSHRRRCTTHHLSGRPAGSGRGLSLSQRAADGPARPPWAPRSSPASPCRRRPARHGAAQHGAARRPACAPPRRALGSGAALRPPPARAGQRPRPRRLAAAARAEPRRAGLRVGAGPSRRRRRRRRRRERRRRGQARLAGVVRAPQGARVEPASGWEGVIAPPPSRPSPAPSPLPPPDSGPRPRTSEARGGRTGPTGPGRRSEHTLLLTQAVKSIKAPRLAPSRAAGLRSPAGAPRAPLPRACPPSRASCNPAAPDGEGRRPPQKRRRRRLASPGPQRRQRAAPRATAPKRANASRPPPPAPRLGARDSFHR